MKEIFLYISIILIFFSIYFIFSAEKDEIMGNSQRIFYIHLPSAIISYLSITVGFFFSILYLRKKNDKYDKVAYCSVELSLVFCTLTLITGSIWAKATWGSYWRWEDMRLTTYLILWFIILAYLLLRQNIANGKGISGIYLLCGYLSVPLSYISIYIFRTYHPIVLSPGGGGISKFMYLPILSSTIAFITFYIYIFLLRIELENLRRFKWKMS